MLLCYDLKQIYPLTSLPAVQQYMSAICRRAHHFRRQFSPPLNTFELHSAVQHYEAIEEERQRLSSLMIVQQLSAPQERSWKQLYRLNRELGEVFQPFLNWLKAHPEMDFGLSESFVAWLRLERLQHRMDQSLSEPKQSKLLNQWSAKYLCPASLSTVVLSASQGVPQPVLAPERAGLIAWQEAKSLIIGGYYHYLPEIAPIIEKAFDERWIEPAGETNRVKSFCHPVAKGVAPFVYFDYTGQVIEVLELAELLGEAACYWLAQEQQEHCLREPQPIVLHAFAMLGEQAVSRYVSSHASTWQAQFAYANWRRWEADKLTDAVWIKRMKYWTSSQLDTRPVENDRKRLARVMGRLVAHRLFTRLEQHQLSSRQLMQCAQRGRKASINHLLKIRAGDDGTSHPSYKWQVPTK